MDLEPYLQAIRDAAVDVLRDDLVGVYTTGSLALQDFIPGRSDVDLIVIAEDVTPATRVAAFAEAISHPRLGCPATGLELSVVRRTAAATGEAGYLLEVNTGPELPPLLRFDAARPSFWFVLDRAVARQSGRALFGPMPAETLAAVTRGDALGVLVEALDYQLEHLGGWQTDSIVLNACRASRFVAENRWFSKPAAGSWAAAQPGTDVDLIELCIETHRRHGRAGSELVPVDQARRFITDARIKVAATAA